MKYRLLAFAGMLLVGAYVSAIPATAQDASTSCLTNPDNNATVIFPDGTHDQMEQDDVITAWYDDRCVGKTTYDGSNFAVAIAGKSTSIDGTVLVDGVPAGETFLFNIHRPSSGHTADLDVTYQNGETGEYQPDGLYVVETSTINGSLPVELVSFDAQIRDDDVVLSWETASETINAGFEVQHKQNAMFEVLGFVEGHGTTTEAQSYGYTVNDLAPGQHVFRLKQIDYDGAFEYSPEVEVSVELPDAFQMSPAYPNPFNPQTQFTLTIADAQNVRVEVFDLLGRRVKQLHRGPLPAHEVQTFRLDASDLTSGVYLIRAAGVDFVDSQRVVLLK